MILRDIKVLDFTRLLPGPMATRWMAEAGATVIKMEDPERPDGILAYSQGAFENAALYETLNLGKEIFNRLTFESLASSDVFIEMVKNSDVLLEQFKPGLMEKLGLGYEAIKAINPKLIYVSLSGYGAHRPEPGHDLNFVAESGLLHLLRDEKGKPVIPRFQMGDISGSYACYTAVLEGLLERSRTHEGSHRLVSMSAAILPFGIIPFRFAEADIPHMADFLAGSIPNYNVYLCADGEYIALAALEFHLWKNVIAALSIPEDLQKAFNNPSQVKFLGAFFLQKTSGEWLALAKGKNCCLSLVCRPGDETFNQSNEERLGIVHLKDGVEMRTIKSPFSI
jgi:alpha-methylacyl-CoA racemase